MDWLKHLLQNLPLEEISEHISRLVLWWSDVVKDIPAAELPMYTYVGGSLIVLVLWILVARMLPRPLGGISWFAVLAILLTPSTALGNSAEIAPASIAVVYGVLMKDQAIIINNLLSIMVVFVAGLTLGFIWQLLRNLIEASVTKAKKQAAADEKATLQLASANYIPVEGNTSDDDKVPQGELIKIKKDK